MANFFGYTRVSTPTQSESGYGLAEQEQAIRKYAHDNNLELAEIFTDAGVSGNLRDDDEDDAINKRTGLIELLAHLETGDTVIVRDTSRLWRSDLTKALVKRELVKRKAIVVSIQQPSYDLYSRDPSGYLIDTILEAVDISERMSISLKLARGRATKAAQGTKPAGRLNYGYKYSSDGKRVEVNPDEAPAVKMMFSMAQCGKSLTEIASALTEHGYTTRKGGTWSRSSVASVLHNTFYTGVLVHAGKTIPGTHEALVSKITFGKVQKKLQANHK